jgi:endonuclease/exonuclease/phosphatase family metal-dependent hydrolase
VEQLKKLGIDYGTALLADTPLEEPRSVAFADNWRDTKGYVVASAGDIDVVSVHLDFLRPAVRRRQIRTLVEGVRTRTRPLVVLGDLNCRGQGRRATLPALIERLGLHPWLDGEPTFPSLNPRQRIDWILLSPELEFVEHRTLPDPVSDHLAVVADIRFGCRGRR